MTDIFGFNDEFGPEKILHMYDPGTKLRAILVIDNIAAGPAIGGTRMAADVSLQECFRLARAMTMKNAAASLPHGGAKAVIFGDPKMPLPEKEVVLRAYAHALKDVRDYIPGPDMGTDERAMAWVHDVTGRAVGLPREIGGIPLDEIGATGFGLSVALQVAQHYADIEIAGSRIAIQGFGAVGAHAARFLAEQGALLVAAADSRGTIMNPDGLDVVALLAWKKDGNDITTFRGGIAKDIEAVIDAECDIWIPAARPDVLTEKNVNRIAAKIVLEGANIPASYGAEKQLAKRGVLVIPDFIANSGGVICASVEYHGGAESAAMTAIEDKIRSNTQEVLSRSKAHQILPRDAAIQMAEERVRTAMTFRKTH